MPGVRRRSHVGVRCMYPRLLVGSAAGSWTVSRGRLLPGRRRSWCGNTRVDETRKEVGPADGDSGRHRVPDDPQSCDGGDDRPEAGVILLNVRLPAGGDVREPEERRLHAIGVQLVDDYRHRSCPRARDEDEVQQSSGTDALRHGLLHVANRREHPPTWSATCRRTPCESWSFAVPPTDTIVLRSEPGLAPVWRASCRTVCGNEGSSCFLLTVGGHAQVHTGTPQESTGRAVVPGREGRTGNVSKPVCPATGNTNWWFTCLDCSGVPSCMMLRRIRCQKVPQV